jgi:hypothetical protein
MFMPEPTKSAGTSVARGLVAFIWENGFRNMPGGGPAPCRLRHGREAAAFPASSRCIIVVPSPARAYHGSIRYQNLSVPVRRTLQKKILQLRVRRRGCKRELPYGGCGNGATVEPVRHRQTKGAAKAEAARSAPVRGDCSPDSARSLNPSVAPSASLAIVSD